MEFPPIVFRQSAEFHVDRRPFLEPQSLRALGTVKIEHFNKHGEYVGTYEFPNGIVDVGLNHILNTQFDAGSQVTTWYIGLIDNASFTALAAADTMSSHAGWIEATAYDEATRVTWSTGVASGRSITNGTTADFSMNATATIKGIFITSNNTKGGTTGTLWSTAAFASNVSVSNGDSLKITYTVSG